MEWSLLDGEPTEQLVGIFLCRENRHAKRIRPSKGDGGIDVLVPEPDNRSVVTVYQAKSFHSNLKKGHKGQIERSYRRLLAYAQANGLTVKDWFLTLPLNPTHENRKWLDELTIGAGFPCDWLGLDYLEGLAAKYPDVIDYYLHNGKERLEGAIKSLNDTIRMLLSPGKVGDTETSNEYLKPSHVVNGLAGLHRSLNSQDPFYNYDYSVEHKQPSIADEPFLVAAKQINLKNQCITFKIFAKCDASLEERPVPINLLFNVNIDPQLRRDLELFDKYGRPFEAPAGTVTVNADLPGGLGGKTSEMTTVRISQPMTGEYHEVRNAILDEAGTVLANVLLKMEPPVLGPSGEGVRAFGTEKNGVFTLEMLTGIKTRNSQITISLGDLAGLRPGQILPGLRFMENFRHPHRLRVSAAYGPPKEGIENIPVGAAPNVAELIEFCEALELIQQHTSMLVEIPRNTQQLTSAQINRSIEAAQLLRGETLIKEWARLDVPFSLGQGFQVGDLLSPSLQRPLVVQLGNTKIPLGVRELRWSVARVDAITDHAEYQVVRFVPAGEAELAISLVNSNDAHRPT